tara:strand:+ start:70 stop:681 length:612 start_codon:yes stop_codon:yes gene_type:complete
MPNYQNGKIYKIINDALPDIIYYGATTNPRLSGRMSKHRYTYRKRNDKNNSSPPTTSVALFEIGEPKIVLIENFPCNTKDELYSRERYYIENNVCVNKNIPLQTDLEYRNKHKEEKRLYNLKNKDKYKQWRLLNKESIAITQKLYAEKNKERIALVSKKYVENNREKVALRQKIYYDKNKEKIKKRQTEYYKKKLLKKSLDKN